MPSRPAARGDLPAWSRIRAQSGVSVADALLEHHVDIEHACGKVAACTTCHCIIRKGFNSLPPAEDKEEDLLDRAWGLTSLSRLSCQAIVQNEDLMIEIPKYSINHAKEIEQKESSWSGSTVKKSRSRLPKVSGHRPAPIRFTDLRRWV